MSAELRKIAFPKPAGESSHSWYLITADAQRINPPEP